MMLHLKKRLSTSGLTADSFTVLYHTAVLLLLTHCCRGQFQVVGPVQPVTVMTGEDVILPCHLKPAEDAAGMTFEWARPDLEPRFVHVWHEGRDLHVNQHPSYKGRTSVSINKLKDGDVSLTLSKVKLSDSGIYRCYFPRVEKVSTVQLVVGTVSSPIISLSGIDRSSSGLVLQCESEGWYPEPEVLWLDSEGHILSAGPTETVRGPDGLYTVSSRVTVEERHRNNFTCRVQQKDINQIRETQIQISDDFFMVPSNSGASIAISLVACLTCVLAVVFAVWKWRRDKMKTKTTLKEEKERLMAESERVKDMEQKISDMVKTLKKQREQLDEQRKTVQRQIEDNDKKLKSLEDKGEITILDLESVKLERKEELKLTEKTLEKLAIETEKLLISAEFLITAKRKEADMDKEEN